METKNWGQRCSLFGSQTGMDGNTGSNGGHWADPVFEIVTAAAGTPVPWEGGPAYYSAFTNAAARRMTSSSFFPVLVDY